MLISITTAFAFPNDTKANQSEVESRAYVNEDVIYVECFDYQGRNIVDFKFIVRKI